MWSMILLMSRLPGGHSRLWAGVQQYDPISIRMITNLMYNFQNMLALFFFSSSITDVNTV